MLVEIWFRCPVCGMRVRSDRLPEDPQEISVFRREFGGRDESVYKEVDGDAVLRPKGHVKWMEIPDGQDTIEKTFIELAIRFLESRGYAISHS